MASRLAWKRNDDGVDEDEGEASDRVEPADSADSADRGSGGSGSSAIADFMANNPKRARERALCARASCAEGELSGDGAVVQGKNRLMLLILPRRGEVLLDGRDA